MPSVDLLKAALMVLLVAALVAVAVWFVADVAPDVVLTGVQATSALNTHAAVPWGLVVALFGTGWSVVWELALGFVVLAGSAFFLLRVIKWVQG